MYCSEFRWPLIRTNGMTPLAHMPPHTITSGPCCRTSYPGTAELDDAHTTSFWLFSLAYRANFFSSVKTTLPQSVRSCALTNWRHNFIWRGSSRAWTGRWYGLNPARCQDLRMVTWETRGSPLPNSLGVCLATNLVDLLRRPAVALNNFASWIASSFLLRPLRRASAMGLF